MLNKKERKYIDNCLMNKVSGYAEIQDIVHYCEKMTFEERKRIEVKKFRKKISEIISDNQ